MASHRICTASHRTPRLRCVSVPSPRPVLAYRNHRINRINRIDRNVLIVSIVF